MTQHPMMTKHCSALMMYIFYKMQNSHTVCNIILMSPQVHSAGEEDFGQTTYQFTEKHQYKGAAYLCLICV